MLLKVSVREIHNRILSPQEKGVIKEERYVDNNIIIIDSTLQSILPPQLKKIYAR